MREKLSLEKAKDIVVKLKQKYEFGQEKCPKWLVNVCIALNQDGSYSISVCIPSWNALTEEETSIFLEPFEDQYIRLRVVTPTTYNYIKKRTNKGQDTNE